MVIHVGVGDLAGPLDVLSLRAVLWVGWDLGAAGAVPVDDTVLPSFADDQGSGLLLERDAFLHADTEGGRESTLWCGGLRVQLELEERAEGRE